MLRYGRKDSSISNLDTSRMVSGDISFQKNQSGNSKLAVYISQQENDEEDRGDHKNEKMNLLAQLHEDGISISEATTD